jgi:hypothetical protein
MMIVAGVLLIIGGLWTAFGPKIPWLGRLPGDIHYQGKNSSFYFPVVTCIIASIVLSIILNLFFRGK